MGQIESDKILELLRETLHDQAPDTENIEHVLDAIGASPGADVIWDYLTDTLRARLKSPSEGIWRLIDRSLSWCAAHPRRIRLGDLFDPWARSGHTCPAALACFGHLARRGILSPDALAPLIAVLLAHKAGSMGASELNSVADTGLTALALCNTLPPTTRSIHGQQLGAALRGAPSWHALRSLGELLDMAAPVSGVRVPSSTYEANADALFDRVWDRLHSQGRPYLHNPSRGRVIGVRQTRFTDRRTFAAVATGAAAVAELSAPDRGWANLRRVFVNRLWTEAVEALAPVGIRLSETATPLFPPGESLDSIDGEFALEVALASAASLGSIGERVRAQHIARVVGMARVPSVYRPWIEALGAGVW